MRRPLADAGLIFLLIIFIVQLIFPHKYADLSSIDGSFYQASGRVVRREYKVKDEATQTIIYLKIISSESLPSSDGVISAGKEIICYLSPDSKTPVLGSLVSISGRAGCFSQARNPGNFDPLKYYDTLDIAMALYDAELISEQKVSGFLSPYWTLMEHLSGIRRTLSLLCDLCFDQPDSGLVKTIFLGDRSSLDEDLKALYSAGGIAHVMAISGLHISLLGLGLYRLLKKIRLPRRFCLILPVIFMLLYGLMTGMAVSAARAVIMFSFRMLAELAGRTYDMATAFVVAALLLAADKPRYLFYSGFQFSFGAILAILIILPVLKDTVNPKLAGPLSVNAVTLPVFLYNYFYFPILSFALNLLVIPLMSLLMTLIPTALAGCAIYVPLGRILAFPIHAIFLFYEYSCKLCQLLPFNQMVTGRPAILQIVVYYLILFFLLVFNKYHTNMQLLLIFAAAGLILTANLRFFPEMTVLDVGQGDCIYITDHRGFDILIDGGSSTESDVGRYRIAPFLLSQGVYELDAVFVTHMDSDHYNGIPWLIENSGIAGPKIKAVYFTNSTVSGDDDSYHELREAAIRKGIEVSTVTKGDSFSDLSGRLRLYCLYPDSECKGEETNEESLVMLMKYGENDILLTGDLEGSGEEKVTDILRDMTERTEAAGSGSPACSRGESSGDGYLIGCNDAVILKVAHHGSKNSTGNTFLDLLAPDAALISAGRDNRYGHPHSETLDRLSRHDTAIFSTIESGAVTVRIVGGRMNIVSYIN